MVIIFQTLVNVTTPAEKLQEEMLQQTSTFPRPMDKLKKYEDVKVIVENLITSYLKKSATICIA
jgi:hypothetical protein